MIWAILGIALFLSIGAISRKVEEKKDERFAELRKDLPINEHKLSEDEWM